MSFLDTNVPVSAADYYNDHHSYYTIHGNYKYDGSSISNVFKDLFDLKNPHNFTEKDCIFYMAGTEFNVEFFNPTDSYVNMNTDFTPRDGIPGVAVYYSDISDEEMAVNALASYPMLIDYLNKFSILDTHGADEITVNGTFYKNILCKSEDDDKSYDFKLSFKPIS